MKYNIHISMCMYIYIYHMCACMKLIQTRSLSCVPTASFCTPTLLSDETLAWGETLKLFDCDFGVSLRWSKMGIPKNSPKMGLVYLSWEWWGFKREWWGSKDLCFKLFECDFLHCSVTIWNDEFVLNSKRGHHLQQKVMRKHPITPVGHCRSEQIFTVTG